MNFQTVFYVYFGQIIYAIIAIRKDALWGISEWKRGKFTPEFPYESRYFSVFLTRSGEAAGDEISRQTRCHQESSSTGSS